MAGSTVSPDQVSLGVLVSTVSRDVIDAAVAACGVGDRRSGGKLPAHVTAYLTMALCLFGEDDYEEVATKVTGSLDRWGCWDASWSVPTSSGITQARKRLGREVFAEIFEGVAEPVGGCSPGGAMLRAWRVLAIDGFEVDLPDTGANAAEFGYAGSGANRSAYPKARVVALTECGVADERSGPSRNRAMLNPVGDGVLLLIKISRKRGRCRQSSHFMTSLGRRP